MPRTTAKSAVPRVGSTPRSVAESGVGPMPRTTAKSAEARFRSMRGCAAYALACLLTLTCSAQTARVSKLLVSRSVDESSCTLPRSSAVFDAADREAFAWFRAEGVSEGEPIAVAWIGPDGAVSFEASYRDLPASPSLCLATRLPIAGFTPASQPGEWTVRVSSGSRTLASRAFRITGEEGPLRVATVRRSDTESGMELTIEGAGFIAGAMVHIAQYTRNGGWRYVSAAQPREVSASRLVVDHQALPPDEYLVIVRNGDGRLSKPVPFLVPTGGYKLPTVAGERWIITQGPYGAFSHWGRTLFAYDIAPLAGRCIVAMRAGTVHVHDVGARQDHRHRTFGNYITIDHGDGTYSHYAHLATGTFVVSEGQRVEQGQALAIVGNSGYTLGEGGGYHVHVQVTRSPSISSPSVPFVFEDFTGPLRGEPVVMSSNYSSKCDCRVRYPGGAAAVASARAPASKPGPTGRLGFMEWWSELVTVPPRAAAFDATLTWPKQDGGLDLHLMSPTGHHYAWYADPTGYTGSSEGPQEFRIANPEPGTWRISVQAVRAGTAPIEFAVKTAGTEPPGSPKALHNRRSTARRAAVRRAAVRRPPRHLESGGF